jgi:hypothetical protein
MTKVQLQAATQVLLAVHDAIRELGEVPSGHLYARLMGHLTLDQYNTIIGILESSGVIRVDNHLIQYIGVK